MLHRKKLKQFLESRQWAGVLAHISCFMQMSLGPKGATHMDTHICLNKTNNDMLLLIFSLI